jgi:nucleoid-associated protein YgaU
MQSNHFSKAFERARERVHQRRGSSNRISTLRFHRVASGDTLALIAEKYNGNEAFWVLVYGSNEASLREAGGLRPGLTLYIPFV